MSSKSIYTIYRAYNKITGKSYIGFDSNWPARQKRHKALYKRKTTKFYTSIRKHGWDNFQWSVLYQSYDGEYTHNVMEQHFIEKYKSVEEGYNMILGGSGRLTFRHTEETKKKIGEASTGRKLSSEARKKQSEYAKNRTKEHRQKLIESRKGRLVSPESIQKRKETMEKNPYVPTEETKKRQSESLRKLYANGTLKPAYGNSKAISIGSATYKTMKEARESLNISKRKLTKMLKTGEAILL
jgi:group I intron endonuclease